MEFTILSTKLNLPSPCAEMAACPRLVELLTPAVMSLTSKKAPLDQGITMGLSNSFVSLGRIAGLSLAGFLFDVNYNLPFWGGAVEMLVGFLVGMVTMTDKHGDTTDVSGDSF